MIRLGITGGIGSGKTSVCRVFSVLRVPVFYADLEARNIMDSDSSVISNINSIAGRDMYKNGSLDRLELANLIFNNEKLLQKVNSTVHPVVLEHFKQWEKFQDSEYVIMEAAILFESGAATLMDRILSVIAPVGERIARVIKRNNLTREQVIERIKNQTTDEEKISKSHYVIDNSENVMIIPAIINIHEEILNIINGKV